ncbi:MAG: Gmad2 immunoglobulin-like domain-containing protein [Candidatus Pacebacteria bacterium]|nr:Gmad2 immunoglobulin-like domain-containing protein [Candidatus Paceibacterota bacterium]
MFKETEKGTSMLALILIIVILVAIVAGGLYIYYYMKGEKIEPENSQIQVENPDRNEEIQSPYIIKGKARGGWYFEATFPVILLDENGNTVKQTYAQAQGDWMTEDFVPFESILAFSVPKDQNGTLILRKDNPSGLPQNSAEIIIPVKLKAAELALDFSKTGNLVKDNPGFKPGVWYLVYEEPGMPALNAELKFSADSGCNIGNNSKSCHSVAFETGERVQISGWKIGGAVVVKTLTMPTQTVKLYYYNPNLDKDSSGNILCSRKGLVALDRQIPITNTPIQDTIKLLISGNLSDAERAQGITTEYPLSGFSLEGASLNNGVLTFAFSDPNNKTGGGSCRVGILWFQIEATAKQFSGITQVRFSPEELFQP